jgi:hypothetical protein
MRYFIDKNIRKAIIILASLQLLQLWARGQDSMQSNSVSIRFLLDTYYGYDFSKPGNHEKPSFFYSHNRLNEFNVNLALVDFSYKDSTKKLNMGIMAGTYPQYNLAAEPGLLKYIYEASVGIKISRKKEVWVEAGIFPSHIGFESAVSHDCWTLTRSIMAENSPYYEAGLKLSSRSRGDKLYWAAMVLNGWQKIKRADGNNGPAFGTQVTFSPGKKFTINSSSYIGAEQPDTARQWRYFHNLYATWQISNAWGLIAGLDIGVQQKTKDSHVFSSWYTPVVVARYIEKKWAIAGRMEYYQDKKGVIVPPIHSKFFRVFGVSMNADRRIFENILWRVEGRWLYSKPAYFPDGVVFRPGHFSITSSLSVSLKR